MHTYPNCSTSNQKVELIKQCELVPSKKKKLTEETSSNQEKIKFNETDKCIYFFKKINKTNIFNTA